MQQPETGRPVRVFFLFEGNVRYNEQKKYKRDDNVSEKKTVTLSHFFIRMLRNNFSGRLSVCRYVRFKHTEFKISDRTRKTLAGHRRNNAIINDIITCF